MNWYQRFTKSLLNAFETSGRARVLTFLRGMDASTLRELGYSPELVREGVRAWPWRLEALEETSSTPSERKFLEAEEELRKYSDAELTDLGIGRGAIVNVVRHGRPGIDDLRQASAYSL